MNNTLLAHYVKDCSILGYAYLIIVDFPSSEYNHNQVVTSVMNCVLTIPVIALNGITVLTLWKNRFLLLKVSNIPVLIQSIADLAVGLLTLPLFAFLHLTEVFGRPDCALSFAFSSAAFIPWGLSLAALCALTLERYISVVHPIFHRNLLTKKTFFAYSFIASFVTLVIVPLAVASAIFYYIFCGVYAIVPVLLHAFCYIRILRSRRKLVPANMTRNEKGKSLKELKLTKSCALVVLTFYVCCIPGEILNLYYLSNIIIYRVVISWYCVALGINTVLNSVIYFWTRPALRKEAIKVVNNFWTA
ncbi:adenosine receptor A3-like [Dendronephthya gigantea]|uniref:adenosine receptor A3-like n=1 Tax=Dendronephthya gigantea TaxID=151771 RepID=UPI00106AB3CF|nr:adenosine receptor A3-like [Dendronephthya gigantea]XP_028401208.1 adenosine receptor A3-like [Dendronephthya gigantea]XP_028401209.1 adenosine receptor A3-like [Dendronephthya gigantea]